MRCQLTVFRDFSFKSCAAKFTLASLILITLAGCNRQSIVLVPDQSGHVGKAEVSTAAGTQTLENANDMTRTRGKANSPSAVTTADPAFIETTFKEALAVEPLPAQSFTLMFASGGAELTADSLQEIPNIIAVIKERSAISVSISGHTDATGSDQLNDALSLERAKRVESLLVQQGVEPGLITVSSHGKGNPLIPTPDGASEPRNRRVVVIIH
ncbi:MAG TPA: OmpA family protein [Methylotenera sp.]|jgi:outer membrane protein OmpA-like peptidoglycan-associated protein